MFIFITGVTTIHPPTTPPYPPPQQLFPVQQLATNLNQVILKIDCLQTVIYT